ncbi:DUF362 domain-containing protein [Crateriforma conspicua]|uniref:DoxX n=1 Tax=Crateriforma conspicua TaxID=2527996 RepID=A0A5C6FQT4_9PLAN|nr:DUF362 domain-containing protein [Crateriforma conspicua]TWU64606.1 DoxX [Crateriforma conspicua]
MSSQPAPGDLTNTMPTKQAVAMWGLRIAIGWLFLYEGLYKLVLSGGWSAGPYLRNAQSPLAPVYQWMADTPIVLTALDFLNVWGLIAVGLGLILGVATRIAAAGGGTMLLLYYLAYPPMIGSAPSSGYGNHLLVNPNLIMLVALVGIWFQPAREFALDRLGAFAFGKFGLRRKAGVATLKPGRRQVLAALAGLPALGLFATLFEGKRRHTITLRQTGEETDGVSGASDTGEWQETPDRSESAASMPVAVMRCRSYEPAELRSSLDRAFDLTGGLRDLVSGRKVSIKINSTGKSKLCCGLPAERTYQSHPDFLAALCACLTDAGAKRIAVVESFYFSEPTEQALAEAHYDLSRIQSAGGHQVEFVNTRNRGKYRNYRQYDVPDGGLMFPAYHMHPAYADTDVFVSLAKLKQHGEAGVTCAAKNLFGITPQALYGSDAPNEDSLMSRVKILHRGTRPVPDGVPTWHVGPVPDVDNPSTYRVPRIITDLNRVRPVDLAIVDGIETIAGGAGPWEKGIHAVSPGLIIVGRNVVCTDTVCSSIMGFDAAAEHFSDPFPGENHLAHLARAGVGTNRVDRIETLGLSMREARFPFVTDVTEKTVDDGNTG